MADRTYSDFALYRRLLGLARPYWGHMAGLFLLNLLAGLFALLTPLPLKIAVDSVIGSHPLPGFLAGLSPAAFPLSGVGILVLAVTLLVLIALLTHLQALATSLLRTYTGEKLVQNYRAQLFRHVQRLSLQYHDSKGTSDSTYRIQYDAPAIQWITIDGIIPALTSSITLVSMLYIIVQLDWQLGLVALAVSPVIVVISGIYRRPLREKARQLKRFEKASFSVIQEVLGALRVVKAFGQEEREQARFVVRTGDSVQARIRLTLAEGAFGLLMGLTTAVGTAVILFIGIRHVQSGVLTLGDLLLVMSYVAQFYVPLKTISKSAASLQVQLAGAERAFTLLDEAPDVYDRPGARPIARASGAITLRQVSYGYSPDRLVLDKISLEIPAGKRVGIAGKTGAGKTTFVSLLIRLFDPTEGQILLDRVDLRDYKLADLRNQFALVLQEPVLFSTTIAENIAYGRPGATEVDIIAAAKAADAHDFIVEMDHGYQTIVGERGMRLSGGERQRIGLARAFLKDAPLLILDEPTSSVDIKTEAAIMQAMERLMQGRTTFMIAHRLSTLERCDVLLRIEGGRLFEEKARSEERATSGPRVWSKADA